MGGSSKSQVVGYQYFAKFALFIGNRIDKLVAINFDNRGWMHKPDDDQDIMVVRAKNIYGENEGGVSGYIDIHKGTPDQQPNPDFQQAYPLVSGFPYQSYLYFRSLGNTAATVSISPAGFYLGNSGYMREMLLWVKRTRVKNDGSAQWYESKNNGTIVCEIDDRFIPIEYSDKVKEVIKNPPKNKWYGTDNFDDKFYEFKATGLLSGYEHNFHSQFGHKGKIGYVKTSFAEIQGLWLFIEVWADDGISSFNWDGGDSILLSEFGKVGYITCRRYIVFCGGKNELMFGVSDQVPSGSGTNHKCKIWASVSEYPWSSVGGNAVDINPIHKIREILTDDTAMNKPDSDINNINFMKAADRIFDEGLGISWAITEKSCLEAIEELCYHIEAGVRVNRQTGLYEVVLFREDWFSENEIHTLPQNKIKSINFEIQNADEIINHLNVSYYDRKSIKNSAFSVYENGSIMTIGNTNSEDVNFPYFMNSRNAEVIAQWKLKQFTTPCFRGTFSTGFYNARKWNRYDIVKITWSQKGIIDMPVRIMKINLGNGINNTVTIDFVEVVPCSGMINSTIIVPQPDDTPEPPKTNIFKAFEMPYLELVQAFGQNDVDIELARNPGKGYVGAVAIQPQSNSLNSQMQTDAGDGYSRASTINYSQIAYLDESVDQVKNTFTIKNFGNIDSVRTGSVIFINDEIMVYESFNDVTKLLTVKRGALDTIPQIHDHDSKLFFSDDFVSYDNTEYSDSEIINVKSLTTTPSGILDIGLADTQSIEIKSRAIRPYPPANVKINGEYYPVEIETDLVITWADRNRIQQTGGDVLGWFDAGVTIEQNTATKLIILEEDANHNVIATHNNDVTGETSYTLPISSLNANTRYLNITAKTVRDGFDSYQPFNHIVELSLFFSAPYDLTVEFEND